MDYKKLCEMQDYILQNKGRMDKISQEKFEKYFDIKYTHNSTAIEGNTLSLAEVNEVLRKYRGTTI